MDSVAAASAEPRIPPPNEMEEEAATAGDPASSSFELPFLVTHWLAHYPATNEDVDGQPPQAEAVQRIRRAAAELSTAFHALGSFGRTTRPLLHEDTHARESTTTVAATYSDRSRQWSHSCPPTQLEHLLASITSTEQVVGAPVPATNLLQASVEARMRQVAQPGGGRTLQDAIDVTEASAGDNRPPPVARTGLHAPLLLGTKPDPLQHAKEAAVSSEGTKAAGSLALTSTFEASQKESADATRHYLDLRDEHSGLKKQMEDLRRSLAVHEQSMVDLTRQREKILSQNGFMNEISKLSALDELETKEQSSNRVIAQLKRQLSLLQVKDAPMTLLLREADKESRAKLANCRRMQVAYRDPLYASTSRKRLSQCVIGRHSGFVPLSARANLFGSTAGQIENMRTNLMFRRMSYSATINSHLKYPIYCLRFDRTGRYFITGADDYLSRVYCLGSHVRAKPGSSLDPLSFRRGAVLLCTLRGHAGVINDIAVSSDNAFLATASEDGDCRVWGLRDGSPIAILRGHTGGANMVSWSTLTPYRLMTAGADGFARCWDIREACLIRYGGLIGKRRDYQRKENMSSTATAVEDTDQADDDAVGALLPPIPVRETQATDAPAADAAAPVPPAPMLPVEQMEAGQAVAPVALNQENESHNFVAGSQLDEGVKLLSKMQHGTPVDERMGGPGTRTRRSAVKVLCVDVCPVGRHVATGADDGICRVFSASDDFALEKLDLEYSKEMVADGIYETQVRRSRRQMVSGRLLLTLKGHLTPITDLKYSYAGDRILSASQREGVVRIWSWTTDPTATDGISGGNTCQVSHILIKLTNPSTATTTEKPSRPGRQRPSRAPTSSAISCDVAAWVRDDSKIVTSQCELVKQTDTEIQPGSQYIFVWDSFTGQCLLGIRGAHSMQCPVVLPHPLLSNVLCSGGADGFVKVWDLQKGECVLEHKNTVDFGPVDHRDLGMISGYLDGSFSPDGTEIVMTDDCGRVTVLDCTTSVDSKGYPSWMREQYFANDYYELNYDQHGYCVERGSEQPPHLAPRGVRCSHSGAPYSEQVNAAFKSLVGPLPEPEKTSCWTRLKYRRLSCLPQRRSTRRNIVSQYDTNTTMIGLDLEKSKVINVEVQRTETSNQARAPRMSNNYRWRDYSDILREEGQAEEDEPDPDDGSFELNESSNQPALDLDDDSDLDDFDEDMEYAAPSRSSTRARPVASRRPARNRPQRRYEDSENSSEDELVEYMSSNNTPSGPFRADYDTHFFRITTGIHTINRDWVRRIESTSAYLGRKGYSPQVGDTVVYIPRAHVDVVSAFPALSPPWQNWPTEAEWPVVRCLIRSVRYRFPYKAFFSQNRSIVAILTLEVTGIPELSSDRVVPWSKPTFVELPRRHVFDLSVFETDASDFIIPIGLYRSRLTDLESVINEDGGLGVNIEAFYGDERENDADLTPYAGRLEGWHEDTFDSTDPNLIGSGYRSLTVAWEDRDTDKLSPWEVALQDSEAVSAISRPRLDEAEKRKVRDALTHIRSIDDVERFFVSPVETSRYSDYETRVEVPMWIDFVRTRLDADYYASKLSVIYDIKLIRENSLKYNGDDSLSDLASTMFEAFCEAVLEEEELTSFREFETTLASKAAAEADVAGDVPQEVANEPTQSVRSSRRQVRNRSSLEALPAPGRAGAANGRPLRISISLNRRQPGSRSASHVASGPNNGRNNRERRTRGLRNGSELETETNAAPVIPLNSGNRGRLVRNSRGQQPRQMRSALAASQAEQNGNSARLARAHRAAARGGDPDPTRRSGRRSMANPAYVDQPSDIDIDLSESEVREVEESEALSTGRRQASRASTGTSRGRNRGANSVQGTRARRSTEPNDSLAEEGSGAADLDMPEDSDPHAAGAASSRRSSRRTAATSYTDQPSDAEIPEREIASTSHRATAGRNSSGSRRSDSRRVSSPPPVDSDENENVASPRSPKRSTRGRTPLAEDDSAGGIDDSAVDSDEISSESSEAHEMDVSDEEEKQPSRRKQRASPARKTQRSSPRRRASRTTYEDPDSSEFGSDAEDEDDSEENEDSRRSNVSNSKRSRPASGAKKPPRKKAKSAKTKTPTRPSLKPWPEINMKKITQVGKALLTRLSVVDEDNSFALPVAEAFPGIADAYSEMIDEPMDFRTIEEDGLPMYRSIRELQNDLVKVFHNCIIFNGETNEYGQLAQSMIDMLEDVFMEVCKDQAIALPSERPQRRR